MSSNNLTKRIGLPQITDKQALSGIGLLVGSLCAFSKNKQVRNFGVLTLGVSTVGLIACSQKQKKGIVAYNNAIKYIKLGLLPAEGNYITLNNNGFIDLDTMLKGATVLNVSENYKLLLFLAQSDEITEIYISKIMYFFDRQSKKKYEYFPERNFRIGDIDDIWLKNQGNKNLTGTINYLGRKVNYNEFVAIIKQTIPSIDNKPHYIGKLGLTLYPRNYKTDVYLQYSSNENNQIYLNENAPEIDITRTFYHEICHAVFKIKGLKHSHNDYDINFENEITARENEAEANYIKHF